MTEISPDIPEDDLALGAAFGQFKRKTQSWLSERGLCDHQVLRLGLTEPCGHPLDAEGNCANASAHLS